MARGKRKDAEATAAMIGAAPKPESGVCARLDGDCAEWPVRSWWIAGSRSRAAVGGESSTADTGVSCVLLCLRWPAPLCPGNQTVHGALPLFHGAREHNSEEGGVKSR